MNAPLDAGFAPYVLSATEQGVCRLTLNRGDRYNPLSRDMIAALQSELARIPADPSVRCFALPGVNVGVFCTTPAVGVARNVARKRVMEMLLTGEPIDAPTALEWGLVNRVVPAAQLDAAIAQFTHAILAKSARLIAQGKQAFYRQVDLGLAPAYDFAGGVMACSLLDADAHEGIDAFVEKRAPKWG